MKKFTLLQSNILYGGIELPKSDDTRLVADWLYIHYKMNISKDADFFRKRLSKENDELSKLILEYDPEGLVLNEVLPYLDRTQNVLKRFGYKYVFKGGEHREPPLTTATLIASKLEMEEVTFDMGGNASAGSAGIYIKSLDTYVLAAYPSAFNS